MEEMDKGINMLSALKKSWKLILLITLVTSTISGIVSYFVMKPVYQSSTQILVNQKNNDNKFDSALLQSNVDLINTYSVIIKSPTILEKVIDKLDLTQSVEELNQKITVNSKEDTQVFNLIVEDNDPKKAVDIANEVSKTFQQEIKTIMNMNIDNVKILADAQLKDNPTPIRPKPLLNIAIATFVGLMLGVGLAFLLDLTDKTLKDDQDVAEKLGLPILGTIQMMPTISKKVKSEPKIKKVGSEKIVSYGEK